MKPIGFAALLLGASLSGAPALADVTGLTLSQGDIFSDPVGTVMDVTVTNTTAATIAAVEVTCRFSRAGKPVGETSTIIYNITAGSRGKGRMQLMGTIGENASCTLSDAPANAPMPAN